MRHRNFRTLKVAAFWHQGPSGWQTGHPWLATEALHHVGFLALTANGSGGWGITQASYHDCHHDELNLTTFRTKYVPQVRSQSWEQRTTVLSDLIYDAGVSKFEGAKGTTVTISSHIKFFWCIPWFHPAKLAIFARPNWTPRNHRILRTETCNPDLFTYIIPVYCIYSILSRFSWTSINTWTITISYVLSFALTSTNAAARIEHVRSPKPPFRSVLECQQICRPQNIPKNNNTIKLIIPILRASPRNPILQLPTAGARRRQLLAQGVLALAEATHLLAPKRHGQIDVIDTDVNIPVCIYIYIYMCVCLCMYVCR